jgi:hypothetical protein
VWKQGRIGGSILIIFLAQFVISMLRFKQESLGRISKKLIMQSLKNFALAIIIDKNGVKRGMFPYFY